MTLRGSIKKPSLGARAQQHFFKLIEGSSNVYVCVCGTRRKKTGTSYANLLSHLCSDHPGFEKFLNVSRDPTQSEINDLIRPKKALQYFGWYDLIINALLPFNTVEKEPVRRNFKHKPMSVDTFMEHLPTLTQRVEKKIQAILPDKFALVLDGWSDGATHYVGVFASFPSNDSVRFSSRLLSFSPLGDEGSQSSREHVEFLTFQLEEVYKKSWCNVVCIVADNCNTNKAIANSVGVPLVGCASHRFNLAVEDILQEDDDFVQKIYAIMSKLRNPTLSAKLFCLCGLRSKTANETRWSSTFEMFKRYMQIREFLPELGSEDLDDLALSVPETRKIEQLMDRLKTVDSVTKELQAESTTLSDVRVLFDAIIDKFPSTRGRLSSNAGIVNNVDFESAVVKVQNGNQVALSRDERISIESLLIPSECDETVVEDGHSFAKQSLKKARLRLSGQKSSYLSLDFILPTSNICERLFSKAGYAIGDRRKALIPQNFESQIFLHSNADLWGVSDLSDLHIEEK